jgi:UDP:flavonoid glycosyltransferase YjiC (YdhE family)
MSRLGHARKNGFRVTRVREPQWHEAWARFERYGWPAGILDFLTHQRWAPLDIILQDILRVVEEEKPDLIVGDGSVGVSTAGHILGVPAAGILNAYNARFFREGSLYRQVISWGNRLVWARFRDRVYRRYGLRQECAIELLRNTPLLSPDLPEFHAPGPEYPHWHAIGPLLSEPPFGLPDWFDELADGTPNVYITMGSTGLLDGLLRRTFDTLGQAPYRFVVTTGGQVTPETIARAPKNFRFADYAPGSRIMAHCRAVVYQGGNGTMYQALAAGLPMLALPSHLEQRICSGIAAREGFGLVRSARHIDGPGLLAAIDTLVNTPQYRANAWRFREAVRHTRATERAADILLAHARGYGQSVAAPSAIRPAAVA